MDIKKLSVEQLEAAADMLKAIAHPKRIAIINYLNENEKLTVTELHELLELEQSSTSHHLSLLKDKGVLISQRAGKHTYYSLKHKRLTEIIDCISKCAKDD